MATKIDKHKLGPRIIALMTTESLNETQVAERLTAEGFAITQPTVSRWLKENRESSGERAHKIFLDHVEQELPKDLTALENLETLCLSWSQEEVAEKVERILTWRRVLDNLDSMAQTILAAGADPKERIVAAKSIVKRCLHWIFEDDNNQKQRLLSIKQAVSIIETKLRFAGVIDSDKDGNIIIRGRDGNPQQPGGPDSGTEKPRMFLVGGRNA